MKGEQSDPIRAAAVDVPTAMFLSSRMKHKNLSLLISKILHK